MLRISLQRFAQHDRCSALDALTLQPPTHLQKRVGIHQEFEIGFDFGESELSQRRITSQHGNIFAWLRFEAHRWINARFASCHTHDFQDRIAVEFVVEPVLVCEEKIGLATGNRSDRTRSLNAEVVHLSAKRTDSAC